PAQAAALRSHLGDPALDAEGIATLRSIIEETGALAATEALIDERLAEAVAASANPLIAPEAGQVLLGLAYAATRRSV
ncbi:MAG: hypothetical protein ACKN9D_00900, partial [Actinomycetales bacterium]